MVGVLDPKNAVVAEIVVYVFDIARNCSVAAKNMCCKSN